MGVYSVSGETVHEDIIVEISSYYSSMTMEVMTVTKALSWLETQAFTNACVRIDSVSMLRKIEAC
jgi:ribonuclease HI